MRDSANRGSCPCSRQLAQVGLTHQEHNGERAVSILAGLPWREDNQFSPTWFACPRPRAVEFLVAAMHGR